MKVHVFRALDTNYFYVLEANKKALIFDPGDAAPVIQVLKNHDLTPEAIWLTHHHHDHIEGVAELIRQYHLPVTASAFDRHRLPFKARGVKEGDVMSFQGHSFQVLEIPGHTLGHIAYYSAEEKRLFSGDTVFRLGCGRLFEGSPKQMKTSLGKIQNLDPDTRIYFAHEYTESNFEFLKKHFSLAPPKLSLEEIQAHIEKLFRERGGTTPTTVRFESENNPFFRSSLETFAHLRDLRNRW